MSGQRRDYFMDLLEDCDAVCERMAIVDPEDRAVVFAALIQSDAINGVRKALLTIGGPQRRGVSE